MIDMQKKVEECDRALETCADEGRRELLRSLRYLWVAIDEDKAAGMSNWLADAETIEKLHAHALRSRS